MSDFNSVKNMEGYCHCLIRKARSYLVHFEPIRNLFRQFAGPEVRQMTNFYMPIDCKLRRQGEMLDLFLCILIGYLNLSTNQRAVKWGWHKFALKFLYLIGPRVYIWSEFLVVTTPLSLITIKHQLWDWPLDGEAIKCQLVPE